MTVQAARKVLAELVPLAALDEEKIEHAVAGVSGGGEVEAGTDMLDVHHFHQDVLTRKLLPIEKDLHLRGGAGSELSAQPSQGGLYALFRSLLTAEGDVFSRVELGYGGCEQTNA